MAENVKSLRRRLRSIRNTNKITRAMQMVSASKLRRAQSTLMAGRPYTAGLRVVLGHLAGSCDSFNHPFFEKRAVKNRIIVIVTGDRGLAGAYNSSIIKYVSTMIKESPVPVSLVCIGRKGYDYFKHRNIDIIASETTFNGSATSAETNEIADLLVEQFLAHKADEVLIVYNEFVSSISYKTTTYTLLPLRPNELSVEDAHKATTQAKQEKGKPHYNDLYLLEPSAQEVFLNLMPRFLRNNFYMTLIEHFTAEHSARMTAMSNATKNSEELIASVSLKMNKARQSAITTELTEVVGGAEALSS
ncbi:ATP synthase F1 subunit gamma [Candidatus Sumerlaeota bacterium]|nr:ATP synthase F1 subunit gamma [Candidatus Sumerlaeota bacterium]